GSIAGKIDWEKIEKAIGKWIKDFAHWHFLKDGKLFAALFAVNIVAELGVGTIEYLSTPDAQKRLKVWTETASRVGATTLYAATSVFGWTPAGLVLMGMDAAHWMGWFP